MRTSRREALPEIPFEGITSVALFRVANDTKNNWQDNLDRGVGLGSHGSPYVDTGETVNDVTVEPPEEGSDLYRVGGDVVQLSIAEFGRRPGAPMPPDEPIRRWARRVGLVPREGETEDDMILGIRRHIAVHGLEGFAPGMAAVLATCDDMPDNLREELLAALKH